MLAPAAAYQPLTVILSLVPMVLTSRLVPTWRNHSCSALTPARKDTTSRLPASFASEIMSAPSPRAKT
ncbi:hypothetical protein D3C72_1801400 [compost metagenome]